MRQRIVDIVILAGLMAVVIMASGCLSKSVTRWAPYTRNGGIGLAVQFGDGSSSKPPDIIKVPTSDASGEDITGWVKVEEKIPLTWWEKAVNSTLALGTAWGAYKVGDHYDWWEKMFSDDSSSNHDNGDTYNIYGNDEVNIANGNGGSVDQKNSGHNKG